MDSVALIRIGFYVCVAAAVIFLVEALYLAFAAPISRKRSVNRRLKAHDEGFAGEQALVRLKTQRGILDKNLEVMGWLSRLLIQSGLRITLSRFVAMAILLLLAIFLGLQLLTSLPTWACALAAIVVGAAIPLQVVHFIRTRRQAAFTAQLPDALDVVVRSLRSGHPVPTAMGLVGREMGDPIGSEFGITIDEMTYGLDLPRALINLSERVGVADLSLLVTAVSIQSGSGGNLSEVLENLSKVLRDRFQLRRKVRALSADGRFSAYGLFILPILIFLAIYLPNPKYYTDAWENPMFKLSIVGLCFWSLLGDYIMYKMIHFKF
jgi:tight adherence protein B